VAASMGDVSGTRAGRGRADVRQHVEPYGVVAWVITGWGWGIPLPWAWRARRSARLVPALLGPLTYLILTVGFCAVAAGSSSDVRRASITAALTSAGFFVLSLVPVPPLDGWVIVRTLARRSPGMEKAHFHLEERNIGMLVALALVLLPRLFPSFPDPIGRLAVRLVSELLRAMGL
jgi:Zn-dependent protease